MNHIKGFILTAILAVFIGFAGSAQAQTTDEASDPEQSITERAETKADTDPEAFEAAFRALKRDNSLQFELPETPDVPEPENPAWLEAFFGFLARLGPLFKVLFYAILGIAVGAILFYILREVIRIRRPEKSEAAKEAGPKAEPLYAPSQAEARILLETVDKLAAEGRFADAVHTLLFRSIQDIDLQRPNIIRRSLTSREIGALDILTPETRDAFSRIARVVEIGFFGGRPLGEADYQTCRDAYVRFTGPGVA